jgi:hypothetical protein
MKQGKVQAVFLGLVSRNDESRKIHALLIKDEAHTSV